MKNSGFTLIEILVVVTIGVILSTAGFLSYNQYKNRRDLELSLQELSATVEQVQNRAVTQEDGNRWSIRFTASSTGEDVYQIYSGDTYSTSSVEQSYSFSRPVYFSEPSGNRSVDLQFEPVSGKIDNRKIITVTHQNSDSRAGDVIVNSLGLVTNRMHDDIVGYWHMDEGTGTSTVDASGQGNDGETVGASWSTASSCVAGQCLDFDGTGDYISIPDSDDLELTNAFTITAWINPTSLSSYMQIVSKFPWSSDFSYQMNTTDTGKLRIDLSSNGTTYSSAISNTSLTSDSWQHVGATWDGSIVKLYVNGNLDTVTSSFTGTLYESNATLDIGRVSGSNNQLFNGEIDEVKIYSSALSSSTIKQMYNDLK